jgi:hypothetical protein
MCGWPLIYCEPKPTFSLGYFTFAVATLAPMIILIWRPEVAWFATAGFILAYYAWIGSNVLPPEGYARLLRSTGFGGGLPVTVQVESPARGESPEHYSGFLLLRTSGSIILYDDKTNRIHEFPINRVTHYEHAGGGLSAGGYKLPARNLLFDVR